MNLQVEEDEREFMINYCKLCDIKYCFMNLDNNELISVIFDGFNNDYSRDVNEIEQSEEDCILFTPASPQVFLGYVNLWDHFLETPQIVILIIIIIIKI